MKSFIFSILLSSLIANCFGVKIEVKTTEELEKAVNEAQPGDIIELAPVQFPNVNLLIENSGEGGEGIGGLISIVGSNDKKNPEEYTRIYCKHGGIAFHLKNSHYMRIASMSIENCKKAIWLDGSSGNSLESLFIKNIEEEAILINNGSVNNDVRSTKIEDSKNGVFVGAREKDWVRNTEDKSDHNNIMSCSFGPNIKESAITLSKGTCCGSINSNYFDGHGQLTRHKNDEFSSFSSIYGDVSGDNYQFMSNSGKWTKNGIIVRGCDNQFMSNYCELTPTREKNGFCINQAPFEGKSANCENNVQISNFQKGGGGITNKGGPGFFDFSVLHW